MTLAEHQEQLTAALGRLRDPQERLAWLIEEARRRPRMDAALRTDANRIEGCLARLWIAPAFANGRCHFQSDSDSLLVKAVAGLLCEIYSGRAPEEIVAHPPAFLDRLGLSQHLTASRRTGLAHAWDRIRTFAARHSAAAAPGKLRLYDAHNHLQDERFAGAQETLFAECVREDVAGMVVNGSCESDWPDVLDLARRFPGILPSFGYHPWYLHERTPDWESNLRRFLDAAPSAVGEIGLDRWKEGLDYAPQEEAFVRQLRLAAERNLPVSIHCLQAWGRLHDLLRSEPRPARGFLLHSYGGPREMIEPLARLGAYFSLPGYFAHERKTRHQETFRHVPPDRLLIETDAPDQRLPENRNRHPLTAPGSGPPLNHPANLRAVYEFAAELTGEPLGPLARRIEENFERLFGPLPR